MKKLYSCMLAMSMALAANATDYYMIGGFNGWALADPATKFTDKGDGTYELDVNGSLTSGFKINDGTWSNDAANFGGSAELVVGQVYQLEIGGGSQNINIAGGNVENAHIVFNPTAATLLITGKEVAAEYVYQLHGNFSGGNDWVSIDMTEENGKWVKKGLETAAASFGIKQNDKETGAQVKWLNCGAESATIVLNTPIPVVVEGSNFSIGAGTYDLTFDPAAMTLTVTGQGEVPPVTEPTVSYQLYGNFSGGDNWYGVDMTVENGKWVAKDLLTQNAAFGIRVNDESGKQIDWINAVNADDATIVLNKAIACQVSGVANFSIASGTYTFTFDPEAMTLTVMGEQGEYVPDYTSWYVNVLGSFNEWGDNGVAASAEGVATHTSLAIGTGEFKVKVWNGADNWYSNGQALECDKWIKIEGNNDANMTIAGATADEVYKVIWDCATSSIYVTKNIETSVELNAAEAADAVYYNLQGARVENPANGIYVKVLNGKTSKVVVK